MVKEGKKRKLVINGVKLEDAGKITCKTNADEASADLGVKREFTFLSKTTCFLHWCAGTGAQHHVLFYSTLGTQISNTMVL